MVNDLTYENSNETDDPSSWFGDSKWAASYLKAIVEQSMGEKVYHIVKCTSDHDKVSDYKRFIEFISHGAFTWSQNLCFQRGI